MHIFNPPNEHGCRTFRADGRRHMSVEIYGRADRGMCHVRRLAYAFAHQHDRGSAGHVAADEEVTNTCGTVGNNETGDGMCVAPEHLIKGKHEDRVVYARERRHLKRATAAMTRSEAA